MSPIVVTVENVETKSSVQHVFSRSPIHIGRNKLNELALQDPFVSLWHAILRFDDKSVEYMDLNSTNGTEVNGQRAKSNVLIPVEEQTDLRIGSLRLHLSRTASATATPDSLDATLFRQRAASFSLPAKSAPVAMPPGTLLFKPAPRAVPSAPPRDRAVSEDIAPGAVVSSLFLLYENYRKAWRALHSQLNDKLNQLPEAKRAATVRLLQQRMPALNQEEQFRTLAGSSESDSGLRVSEAPPQLNSETALHSDTLPHAPSSAGTEVASPGSLTLLRSEWGGIEAERNVFAAKESAFDPDGLTLLDSPSATLLRPAAVEPLIPTSTASGAATVLVPQRVPTPVPEFVPEALSNADTASASLLRIFAQTYASEAKSLESPAEVERFLNQLAAVLEAFSKAFVELRRGHDQFGKEVAVPTGGDQTPLRNAKTPRDVLRYLLDSNGHGAENVQALTRGFADVMIHQVALLNGIREGIGALLKYVSPEALLSALALSRNRAASFPLRAWPVRALALWRPYVRRHQELTHEERAIQAVVFGQEFAFAYAQIVGGNASSPSSTAKTAGRAAEVKLG